MRQIILDTETTGLVPQEGHRITEIGCVELINRKITGNTWQTYLNPEREIDAAAAKITGLSWEFLQDKPKFSAKIAELLEFIAGAELIIHNAPFDLGFLNNELQLMQHPTLKQFETKFKILDTLQLARKMHPGQKNSLDALCKRYKIDNTHRHYHGALLDSEILAEVYLVLTAGQITMDLKRPTNVLEASDQPSGVKVAGGTTATPVIYASEQELAAHQQYLVSVKQAAGVCVWQDLGITTDAT